MTTPTESAVKRKTARPRRKTGRRLLFLAVTLGALGVVQELAFRLLFPVPEVVGFNRIRYQLLADMDPRFRPVMKRGLVYDRLLVESRPDGFEEIHRLNQYGFRGPDFTIEPPAGSSRVLVIGDSVTEGQGAPEGSTIAAELARLLGEKSTGPAPEVINLGVIAANLPLLTALTRDAVPLLRPTDVVLVLYANDLPAPPYSGDLDQPPPRFAHFDVPGWMPRGAVLVSRAVNDEPIYTRWPKAPVRYFAAAPDPTNPWSKAERPAEVDPELYRAMKGGEINPWLVEQARAIPGMLDHDFGKGGSPYVFLRRIASICHDANARLVVAYVPFCGVTHPRYASAQTKLGMTPAAAEGIAKEPRYRSQSTHLAAIVPTLNVPLIDATAALARAEESGTPQFWEFDTHPRPAGYATIAKSIADAWPTTRGDTR